MADGDDDSGVRPRGRSVRTVQGFEVHTVMGQDGLMLADCVTQLLRVTGPEVSSLLRRHGDKAARSEQGADEHVDVFVHIDFDKKPIHDPLTSGSMRSSEIRLRSIHRWMSS